MNPLSEKRIATRLIGFKSKSAVAPGKSVRMVKTLDYPGVLVSLSFPEKLLPLYFELSVAMRNVVSGAALVSPVDFRTLGGAVMVMTLMPISLTMTNCAGRKQVLRAVLAVEDSAEPFPLMLPEPWARVRRD